MINLKTIILGLAIGLSLVGCVREYHNDKKGVLISEVPKSIGTSFSNLLQRTGAQVSIVLPLRYPAEWPKEKLQKELATHAYYYGQNVMYVNLDGKIILNDPDADRESYWENNFATNYFELSPLASYFHWEQNIRKEFALDGSITVNYILLESYYEENGKDEDFYVIFVKNDKIIGYMSPFAEYRAGDIEYEKSHFGFFVF